MRKSFTRLCSFLVLLLLSVQMALAAPTLISGGLIPADGGIVNPVNPVFTMTFQADVQHGELQIIGLYNTLGETKAIQLKNGVPNVGGGTKFSHSDGDVIFNGKVVTIMFKGVDWLQLQNQPLWITVGASAIKDASGNFNAAAVSAFGATGNPLRWEFTVEDITKPTVKALFPKDDAIDVPTTTTPFKIKFNETVRFVDQNPALGGIQYNSVLGDFALYLATDGAQPTPEEGGDLVKLLKPTLRFFLGGSNVPSSSDFDSITISWFDPNLPNDTKLYMRVKPGIIEDVAGNDFLGINNEILWNFHTKDDLFVAPVISMVTNTDCGEGTIGNIIRSDNNFTIDFADYGTGTNQEKLFYNGINASGSVSFDQIIDQTDLKRFITIKDKNNNVIDISTAKITTIPTNTITVDPLNLLQSSGIEFTVSIDAGVFIDASGNLSKAASRKFAAGNWDAPTVVNAEVINQTGTYFDFVITTNEPCAVHYIVVRTDVPDPGKDEIFGHTSNSTSPAFSLYKNTTTNADIYYDVTSFVSPTLDLAETVPPIPFSPNFKDQGNYKHYYGTQSNATTFKMYEKFAEGNIIVNEGNVRTLKRITGLPATHGMITEPLKANYEIWYTLIDTLCTQGKYDASYWKRADERISGPHSMTGPTVFTTDILPPEAWFDADTAKVVGDNLPNRTKLYPPAVAGTTLGFMKKDGKIYINFNEPIRKENGSEFSLDTIIANTELHACLFVHEGSLGSSIDLNSDAPWTGLTSYGYRAKLVNGNTQIVIRPDSSWNSSDTIYVKIKNSKIEDLRGNEIVPRGGLYTERFKVESYIPPLVRYTFNTDYKYTSLASKNLWSTRYTPLDSMIKVPFKSNLNTTVAPITVTVSGIIHAYTGCWVENDDTSDPLDRKQVAPEEMLKFSNDTTRLNYVGKFFKIRKGTGTTVDENTGNPIETSEFIFTVDYNYGDSTKIIITPKKQYDSEVWYFVQLDGRVKDTNQRTINDGAAVDNNGSRPAKFSLVEAATGNARTVAGWTRGDATRDDNKTCVFKSEDSRNPVLTFYTKKQSTLLSNLVNINRKTNISLSDTIGVYIDEYVSLGFDHYVHFDALTNRYTLDANAMRRYFNVYEDSITKTKMQFDVVGLDTTALMSDSLIFYIDPYYVNADGTYKSGSESANFKSAKKYWVHFNSKDVDDFGIENKFWGKEKGIYWDDNQNLVLDKWASFTTVLAPDPACISAVITPKPSDNCLVASAISYITVGLPYAPVHDSIIPNLYVREGAATVRTLVGKIKSGDDKTVEYAIAYNALTNPGGFAAPGLRSDSTYTVALGTGAGHGGQIYINSGNPLSWIWPKDDCDTPENTDSTWTYKMVDETAPVLDTLMRPSIANYGNGNNQYPSYLYPQDDTCGFDKTKNLIMVFNEEVQMVNGKTLRIYDSNDNTKAIIYAQQCYYGKQKSPNQTKDDKNVIIIPANAFTANLEYNTDYHISVDAGFVKDMSSCMPGGGNDYRGVFTADLAASCGARDLSNDWSFRTGSDPAPYFTSFSPKDAAATVSTLTITFSEEVFANVGNILIDTIGPSNAVGNAATFSVTNSSMIRKGSDPKTWEIYGFTPVYGKQYFVTIPQGAFRDGLNQQLTVGCSQGTIAFDNSLPIGAQTSTGTAQWYINFRDAIAPFVRNTWPRDGKKQIPYNAHIYIEFNEPIKLMDGTAIVPDPLLAQNIDKFITVSGLTTGQYDVEFVDNNKRLIRITPWDPAGYNYNAASLPNPTMKAYSDYTVTLVSTWTTYTLVDVYGNPAVGYDFEFRTEDVTPPVISAPAVTKPSCGSNEFTIRYTAFEAHNLPANGSLTADRDTVITYWAVLPSTATAPTAAELFAQNVPGATVKGIKGGTTAGGVTIKAKVAADNAAIESANFKLYAVAKDNEKDIWIDIPTGNNTVFDTLFMFIPANGYTEDYTRIHDIKLAPNTNNIVVPTTVFRTWDLGIPQLADSYPHSGEKQIPVNAVAKFWFKEKVESGSVLPNAITLRRYDNNIAVAATVAWPTGSGAHPDSIFTITPTAPLDQETKYYIEFDRYAIQDTQDVCPAGTKVFYPQMVGRGYWFVTEDNIGPRFEVASPAANATCVSCPGLNANGADSITLDFYDSNPVYVAANAADPFVYFYRANVSITDAWLVVPTASLKIFKDAAVDTLYHVKIPVKHQYYPNDLIRVIVPAGVIVDSLKNKYSNPQSSYQGSSTTIVWNFTTCNTEPPVVTWSIHQLEPYFNYSEKPLYPAPIEPGIYAKWNEGVRNGTQGEAEPTQIPTNIALKINFGEEVEFNTSSTSTPKWKTLSETNFQWVASSSSKLTPTELMTYLKIQGLTFKFDSPMSKSTNNSDIDTIVVAGNTVTIMFKKGAADLPVSKILAQAKANNQVINLTGASFPYLGNTYKYKASLKSNNPYEVYVADSRVRAKNNCVANSAARYVNRHIVTLNTRDDNPPTVDFKNAAGQSLCANSVCVGKNEPITISFSNPVVKTSVDVNWLALESSTFDNLPLRKEDLLYPVKGGPVNHYIGFYKLNNSNKKVIDTVTINNVTLDPAKTNYIISSNQELESEQWYGLVFKKYTVKKYIDSDPTGTIYESTDTCKFMVGDYINPYATTVIPTDGSEVGSDTKLLKVIFSENVLLGTTSEKTRLRRQDGSIYKEFTVGQTTLQNAKKTDGSDTIIFNVDKLENFTKYYVEMPVNFVTDDNSVCAKNPFAGFAAKLDPSTGLLLSADWSFITSDSTAPELMAVVNNESQRSPDALYPKVGSTVSTNSDLIMVFDENIQISSSLIRGIVIYHDNGDDPNTNFGNAVEYIPWANYFTPFNNGQITISGSNPFDGLSANVITINPETVFDRKGRYYVRVSGIDITDGNGNTWDESINVQRDEIRDEEWYFSIVNDAAPILVTKTPAYDGVNSARTYNNNPETGPAPTLGYVKTSISMTFEDADGAPIDVAPGSSTRMLKIFEYTYDAASASFKSKPWITLPITDPNIKFVGNVVTVENLMLRDGINGRGTSLATDSVYYVTVDEGAIVNALDQATAWWVGINNGFVWRFQTASDNTFVGQEDIISPNIVENGDGAKNLTIAAASTLEVKFGEAIEAIPGALGTVNVCKVGQTTPAIPAITVTNAMIVGADKRTLRIPITGLVDETSYYVQIQAGAFGDTSTVSTKNTAFGGPSVWQFQTGDNTPPDAVTKSPSAGCVGSSATLTMTFDNESRGVVKGAGILTVKDPQGTTVAQVLASDVLISANGKTVTAAIGGPSGTIGALPDNKLLTVNVPAGFLLDGDLHSALPNPVISWTFTTGENTPPTVVSITPAEAQTSSTLISIKFSEKVVPSTGTVTIGGTVVNFTTTDSITYTYMMNALVSESTYAVVVGANSFKDLNVGCVPNQIAKTDLSFTVADIIAPEIVNVTPKAATDYKLLKLEITFSEAVTPKTGNVVIYNSADVAIETIASSAFTANADKTVYTYSPANVKYGSYYILVQPGAFTDVPAAAIAEDCAGISSKSVWPLVIVDPNFVDCYHIIYPLRADNNVPVTTTVVIDFCDERIAAGTGLVTIGDQSVNRVLGVNYFEYPVVASMISNGNKLSIPVTGLKENTTYSIIIPRAAITDEAGNLFSGITDANLWIFTTGDFTNPTVTVDAATIIGNDGINDPIAITSSEAGKVYLAKVGVETTETALMAAILAHKAVYAVVTTGGVAVSVNGEGLEAGTYKAYAFDASGKLGTSVNSVIIDNKPIVPYKTIKQIQGEVAASPLAGTRVRTNGTITAVTATGFYMQDANAAWSGIFVSSTKPVGVGSSVEVIGTVAEVSGLTTIGTVEEVTFVGPVVTPKVVAIVTTTALAESLEGVLVTVKGKATAGGAVTADWTAGTYTINNALYGSYTTKKDFTYEVTGIEIQDGEAYKVLATVIVNFSEINSVNNLSNAVKVYPNPFDKYITLSVSNDVVITKAVITNIAGQLVKEVINPNNTIPTSELRSGVYFISLHTVDGIAKTERIIKR